MAAGRPGCASAAGDRDRALDAAMQYVAEQGVTSIHNMGTGRPRRVPSGRTMPARLRTRIYAAVPLAAGAACATPRRARHGRGDEWLRIGGLKGFVDGSLGSHTAAFHEPFTDVPGEPWAPRQRAGRDPSLDRRRRLGRPARHGARHRRPRQRPAPRHLRTRRAGTRTDRDGGRRFRIEHAQHIAPADIPRFGSSASSPACSRTTPSTTAAGPTA
jgi:predicted amidohydrolase YtcJ